MINRMRGKGSRDRDRGEAWRRRLCERLDLDPEATSWPEVEQAVIVLRGAAALAQRDHAEMLAFLGQAQRFWHERGSAGEPGPDE